jgi:hypothetical protein
METSTLSETPHTQTQNTLKIHHANITPRLSINIANTTPYRKANAMQYNTRNAPRSHVGKVTTKNLYQYRHLHGLLAAYLRVCDPASKDALLTTVSAHAVALHHSQGESTPYPCFVSTSPSFSLVSSPLTLSSLP